MAPTTVFEEHDWASPPTPEQQAASSHPKRARIPITTHPKLPLRKTTILPIHPLARNRRPLISNTPARTHPPTRQDVVAQETNTQISATDPANDRAVAVTEIEDVEPDILATLGDAGIMSGCVRGCESIWRHMVGF